MWEPKENRNVTEDENKFRADATTSEKDEEFQSQCQDSGFVSGPQNLSEQFSDIRIDDDKPEVPPPKIHQNTTNVQDSGLIEDIDESSDNMLLVDNSSMVADMSERLGGLSLQSMNNLGAASKARTSSNVTTVVHTPTEQQITLLQKWENYYRQDDEGDTQLHLAIINKLVDATFALIRIAPHPCLLDIQNDLFQAPLHLAVITSQPSVVRRLLFCGAEATVRDRYGNSPLHLACISGDLACVKALTDPLTAEERCEKDRIKSLTGNGCFCLPDLEQRNYDGELCVHVATMGCHIDVLRHLIYSGADINAREGKSGRTPLHMAIEERKDVVVNFLLEECTDKLRLETVTYAGLTAYQLAAINENNDFLSGLTKKGAEPLSPPESDDDESDFDENMMDRYSQQNLYRPFNGASAINVS